MLQRGQETLFMWVVRAMVLMTAMPVHECAHALAADKLGDDTARKAGRVTLNPFRHLELWGSLLLIFAGFGWAKPVPVNAKNFKHPRRDMALTAAAGPISNVLQATVLLIVYKVIVYTADIPSMRYFNVFVQLMDILLIMLQVNLTLAVFNLLPVPPLDGSKLFGALLPDRLYFGMMRYEQVIMLALFAVIMFTDLLTGPMNFLMGRLLTVIDFITRPVDLLLS